MHLSNRNTKQWQKLDSDHHLHPFTDYKELKNEGSKIIVSAKGNYVFDSDNNELLAVAKMSQPFKKDPNTEALIKVRLDY